MFGRRVAFAFGISIFAFAPAFGQTGYICHPYAPIRATGSSCNSPYATSHIRRPSDGVVVCCLAQPSTSTRRSSLPSQRYGGVTPSDVAAGIQIGITLFGLVAQLIEMLDSGSTSEGETNSGDNHYRRREGERDSSVREAAELDRKGVALAKSGEDRTAYQYFKKAYDLTRGVNGDLAEAYYRKMFNVLAQSHLKEAARLEAEGFLVEAVKRVGQARADSIRAGGGELMSVKIRRYENALKQKLQANPANKDFKPSTDCIHINGQYRCK